MITFNARFFCSLLLVFTVFNDASHAYSEGVDCGEFQDEAEVANTLLLLYQEGLGEGASGKQIEGIFVWWESSDKEAQNSPEMRYRIFEEINGFSLPFLGLQVDGLSKQVLAYGVAWNSDTVSPNNTKTIKSREIMRFNVGYKDKGVGVEGFFDRSLQGQDQLESLTILGCASNLLD